MGVVDVWPAGDLGSLVNDHHQKLFYAYDLARRKMREVPEQAKQRYDRKAHATPLLLGERVWVRNRNRQGQGSLAAGTLSPK